MIIIQPIGIIFCVFIIYYTYLHYRKGTLSLRIFGLWTLLWIGLVIVIIFPSIVNVFLEGLGINRALDLFVIVGILILLGIVFHNYIVVHSLEKRIEQFTRNEALEKLKDNKPE